MQNRSRGRRRARCYRGLLLCIFPRPIAVLLAVCLVLCVVAVVGFVVAASLVDAVDSADVYIAKLDDILNSTRLWMYDLGMNDTDIDNLYGQIPATAVAVGGVTTLGGAVVDFCIILLFATCVNYL
jgi:predicted PurR-regulated permease PerM